MSWTNVQATQVMALDSYLAFVPYVGVYDCPNAGWAASGTDRKPDCVVMMVTAYWLSMVTRLTLNSVWMVDSFGPNEMTLE